MNIHFNTFILLTTLAHKILIDTYITDRYISLVLILVSIFTKYGKLHIFFCCIIYYFIVYDTLMYIDETKNRNFRDEYLQTTKYILNGLHTLDKNYYNDDDDDNNNTEFDINNECDENDDSLLFFE